MNTKVVSFNIVIEEAPKAEVLNSLDQQTDAVAQPIIDGMKAIVKGLKDDFVSIALTGCNDKSGYVTASWHSHSEVHDLPTDEERMLPNEPGYERDEKGRQIGELRKDWAGMRDRAMTARLGRAPR